MRTRGRSFEIAAAKHAIFAQKYGRLLQLPGGARFVIFFGNGATPTNQL
jgi:hypothetical protein